MASNKGSRNLVSYHESSALPVARVDTKAASWECHSRRGLDPIAAEFIEADAGTMVDNDNNKWRRLVEFKDGCRYGKFGKTKAYGTYELIADERIRAYKIGGKTMIDLDSVDEYYASLPRIETRPSQAADLRSKTAKIPSRRL
ncbi:MAG: hypothetical protein QHD01_21265 [Bradyrhizobium sp.]|uniref:hypothetical protein n=1 Tax=Bradyrhizobium sp. TaxID=376 RepID=UPI0029BDBF4B|nr:hypothetical protein [Bradyrhizobium sp.]MDX3969108.1 hypothetical protein [Bradyrhizobium sp.]